MSLNSGLTTYIGISGVRAGRARAVPIFSRHSPFLISEGNNEEFKNIIIITCPTLHDDNDNA